MLVLVDPDGASEVRYRALDLTQWLGRTAPVACLDLRTLDLRIPDDRTEEARFDAFVREAWRLVERQRRGVKRLVVVTPEFVSARLDEVAFWLSEFEDESVHHLRASSTPNPTTWAEPGAALVLSDDDSVRITPWRPEPIRLETPRLVLTEATPAQSAAYFDLIRGTDVFDTLLWEGPNDVEDLTRMTHSGRKHRIVGSRHGFAVIESSTGAQIGGVSYRPTEMDPEGGDIGYMIAAAHQRNGYGREAVDRLVRFAFEDAGAQRIWADIYVDNDRSASMVSRLGFELEGTLVEGIRKRGVRRDEWRYAITRSSWASRQA